MRRLATVLVVAAALAAGCDAGHPAPTTGAPAAISCASGSIKAQGSSAQTGAVNTWIRAYQVGCPDASIEYDSVGSGAGLRDFVAGDNDFAGSDSPLSAGDQPGADRRCAAGPAIHLPMVVGPIALAYNVAGVGDLRLRPATLARIFAGTITTWDDPAVAADNPGAVLPSTPVVPVHRADNSGTTDNFTRYLAATAAADWSFGHSAIWPAAVTGDAEQGSDGVSAAVARSDGAIGYVEWSYARFHDLATALIGNGAKEFVALTDDAAGRAVASATVAGSGADLRLNLDYGTTARGAYPIVLVTYEVVCQRGTAAASLGLVKSFLAYTSSAAGQATVTRLGYAPLPEKLRARVAATVAALG